MSGYGTGIGSHTLTATATDNAGRQATATLSYSVIFSWSGFFSPVDNLPKWNSAKAGSSIPVKFSLSGDQGLSILAGGSPSMVPVACPNASVAVDAIEVYVSATNSKLIYDATADQYNYVWKTDKAWAGRCYQLNVTLVDGTTHSALFQFTK